MSLTLNFRKLIGATSLSFLTFASENPAIVKWVHYIILHYVKFYYIMLYYNVEKYIDYIVLKILCPDT